MSEFPEDSEGQKMELKDFGGHLVEITKDLKYIGFEIKKSASLPLKDYQSSSKEKSDIEEFCQNVGTLLETARLNIDHIIDGIKEKIIATEDNPVLQQMYERLNMFSINSRIDQNCNLNKVDSAPELPVENVTVENDEQLLDNLKEIKVNTSNGSFPIDIVDHELTLTDIKSDSQDTIITSQSKEAPLYQDLEFQSSTIPDNVPLDERLAELADFAEHNPDKSEIDFEHNNSLTRDELKSESPTKNLEDIEKATVSNTNGEHSKETYQKKTTNKNSTEPQKSQNEDLAKVKKSQSAKKSIKHSTNFSGSDSEEIDQTNSKQNVEESKIDQEEICNKDIPRPELTEPSEIDNSEIVQNVEEITSDEANVTNNELAGDLTQVSNENVVESNIVNQDSEGSFVFNLQDDIEPLASQLNDISDDDTCEPVLGSYSTDNDEAGTTVIDDTIQNTATDETESIRLARNLPAKKIGSDSESISNSYDNEGSDIVRRNKRSPKKLPSESDKDAQSEEDEVFRGKKRARKLSSESNEDQSDNRSDRSFVIKKQGRKLESDISDDNATIKDNVNSPESSCTTNISSEIEKERINENIEDPDKDSNSSSDAKDENNDDPYSSEDDSFDEIAPVKLLVNNAAGHEDKNQAQANASRTSEDLLNELIREFVNSETDTESVNKTDGKSPEMSQPSNSPPEQNAEDFEEEKDQLLSLLQERIDEIRNNKINQESEINKSALLDLLEERDKLMNQTTPNVLGDNICKSGVAGHNTPEISNESGLLDVLMEENIEDLSPEKAEQKEAEEIYQRFLVEHSESTDISDSDDDFSSVNIDNTDIDTSDEELFDNFKDQYGLKRLSVKIEQMTFDKSMLEKVEINRDQSDNDSDIDRLCDLRNVLKRKCGSSGKKQKRIKRHKKSGSSRDSAHSSSDSFSDYNSDSDTSDISRDSNNFLRYLGLSRLSGQLSEDEDEMLADALCEKMSGCSSEAASEPSDDENNLNKKKVKKESPKKGTNIKKEPLSNEEIEKRSWRKDGLLHGTIDETDTESDSSTNSNKRRQRINEKIKSRFKQFKEKLEPNNSDSDSDSTQITSQDLGDATINNDSGIGNLQNDQTKISGSDTDSEIEFVTVPKTPPRRKRYKNVIDVSDDEAEETTPTKGKGRRNIRALVSDENLAESTQKAQAEENRRIARLEERQKIKETFSQSFGSQTTFGDEDCLVLDMDKDLNPIIRVHPIITARLKPHQKDGVQFMWESCYESVEQIKEGSEGSGCILAHCMGLGKTLQALALIHTLFSYEVTKTKHVLVVCPLSTVPNWKNEFKLAYGKIKDCKIPLHLICADKKSTEKYDTVRRWNKRGGLLVLGYEAFGNLTDDGKLDKYYRLLKDDILAALVNPGPDLVICDEGHLLRNKSSRRTLSLNKIRTQRRIVLTGTPLQNNLLEYYHMVNFVKPSLIGTEKEYKTNFVNPITNGQYEDSTAEDIRLMKCRTHILHRKLKKTVQRVEDSELKLYLPKLVDYAVFIQLHKVQVDFYLKYLDMALSRGERGRTFLADVQILKYIGSHPHVLEFAQQLNNKKIKEHDVIDEIDKEKVDDFLTSNKDWWKSLMPKDAARKIEYGNKFQVVLSIIEECEKVGDKMLIFSTNYAEMDSLEHFLKNLKNPSKWHKKTDYYRMDGTVPPEERTAMCDRFNDRTNTDLRLLIMSTKVGGLGLNLTGANRVIILNVNWNPSYDSQSVFRTFRFGQEKEVFVYRLISMDTMEEKIYQRQVTKLAVAHRVVDKHQVSRHYNSTDIMELYSVRPNADEERSLPNLPEDQVLAKVLQKHTFVFRWHEHQQLLANRPEEDLNEAEKNAAWEEFNRKANEPPVPSYPQFPMSQFPSYLPSTQQSGFIMASMLANNPGPSTSGNGNLTQRMPMSTSGFGTASMLGNNPGPSTSGNVNLMPRMPLSSSVVNINNLPNGAKQNSIIGLESPSEDHDYCLPKASPVVPATQPITVSPQTTFKPPTPVRKLIFSPNTSTNVIVPNPANSQISKNLTDLNSHTTPTLPSNIKINPLVNSVKRATSRTTVSNSNAQPSTSSTSTSNTVSKAPMPRAIIYPKGYNDVNRQPPATPLLSYSNPRKTTQQSSMKNNAPVDPLFIDPKLIGSNGSVTMSYQDALTLAEKLSNAKKAAEARQNGGQSQTKSKVHFNRKGPVSSSKYQIQPNAISSGIKTQMSNTMRGITLTNASSNNKPSVRVNEVANTVSLIPVNSNKKNGLSGLTNISIKRVDLSKSPVVAAAKKSNKENKKNLSKRNISLNNDVIVVGDSPGRPNAPASIEVVNNLSHMKEISINKVQKGTSKRK